MPGPPPGGEGAEIEAAEDGASDLRRTEASSSLAATGRQPRPPAGGEGAGIEAAEDGAGDLRRTEASSSLAATSRQSGPPAGGEAQGSRPPKTERAIYGGRKPRRRSWPPADRRDLRRAERRRDRGRRRRSGRSTADGSLVVARGHRPTAGTYGERRRAGSRPPTISGARVDDRAWTIGRGRSGSSSNRGGIYGERRRRSLRRARGRSPSAGDGAAGEGLRRASGRSLRDGSGGGS